MTLAFTNSCERTGAVTRCALLIKRIGRPGYQLLPWESFVSKASTDFVYGSAATPITVPARSVETQVIRFMWYPISKFPGRPFAGNYELKVVAWTQNETAPSIISLHRFTISQNVEERIPLDSVTRRNNVYWIALDNRQNYVSLTDNEAERLLQP